MNYRHAFHAGNFADLVKHAALLQLLARLTVQGGPLTVIDTHAGRGLYDLAGADARRSGEADDGIVRLMAQPESPIAFGPLIAAVSALNGKPGGARYPGSPWLIAEALRPTDSLLACELRPDEHQALAALMKARGNVRTLDADGYGVAMEQTPPRGRVLLLIDPPFERADDYEQIVETLASAQRKNQQLGALVWLPLKDLETFDRFLRELEDTLEAPVLVAETRMRPLTDPLKMNGCALVLLGAPDGMAAVLESLCGWTAATLGANGTARVYSINP